VQGVFQQRYRLRKSDLHILTGGRASELIQAELNQLFCRSGRRSFFMAGYGDFEKVNVLPGEQNRIGNIPLAALEEAARQSGQLFAWAQLTGFWR
jgi:hypothetical protein